MRSIRRWVAVLCLATLNLTSVAALAQISRLPEDVQKRLAEINPLYQSDIRRYGPETIRLFTPLVAMGPKAGVIVTADEAYGSDAKQKVDVYRSEGARDLPVIVFVHGGALTSGDKNENKEIAANVSYYFARHGFLAINANYRLAPQHPYPEAAQDIGAIVAWIKGNAKRFGGDPERTSHWPVYRRAARSYLGVRPQDSRCEGAGHRWRRIDQWPLESRQSCR